MGNDLPLHHRRSIRLEGYDYTETGAYFVTLCAQNHLCLFGDVIDGEMRVNAAGRMVQSVWDALPRHYPGIGIDVFVVMPNHVHGIILIGAAPGGRPPDNPLGYPDPGQTQGSAPTGDDDTHAVGLTDVVQRFKMLTTHRYIQGVREQGWPAFSRRLWQRNYYEHVIRNDESLNAITDYIMGNPAQWTEDRENPSGTRWQSPREPREAWRV